ncbi:hypothetical protein KQH65_06465 [archaeon]|nr:hypothetical protein [archaeon]
MFGNLIGLIIFNIIFQAPALWYAAKHMLGPDSVVFWDAVKITAVFTVINALIQVFIGAEIAELLQIIAYLYLVRKYWGTSWKNAVLITLLMVFINVVIGLLLAGPGLFLFLR